MSFCSKCGAELPQNARFCGKCGEPVFLGFRQPISASNPNNIYVQQPQPTIQISEKSHNGVGTAGFVFAILSIFLGWIPVLGYVINFLGFLLSLIGIFKRPRGLAIAGLIISLLDIIIILVGVAFIKSLFT